MDLDANLPEVVTSGAGTTYYYPDHVVIGIFTPPPRSSGFFGLCWECEDGEHDHCMGVPCDCPCPTGAWPEEAEITC